MFRPRFTAALLCGAVLTVGLAAAPASASTVQPARPTQAAAPPLNDTLSDTPRAKPRPTQAAAGQLSEMTASAAGACAPEIVSKKVTPKYLKVGVTAERSSLFEVVLNDPCNVVGYLSMDYWATSGVAYDWGYMQWDGVDSAGLFHASVVLTADPYTLTNDLAGTWDWGVSLMSWYEEFIDYSEGSAFYVQRASTLTVNAAPEPVRKGATITVTGLLQRASWNTGQYASLGNAKLTLQKRSLTGSYVTVKTLTTGTQGRVSYTVAASSDVCYRLVFAGYTTTPAVTSGGDCVDVV